MNVVPQGPPAHIPPHVRRSTRKLSGTRSAGVLAAGLGSAAMTPTTVVPSDEEAWGATVLPHPTSPAVASDAASNQRSPSARERDDVPVPRIRLPLPRRVLRLQMVTPTGRETVRNRGRSRPGRQAEAVTSTQPGRVPARAVRVVSDVAEDLDRGPEAVEALGEVLVATVDDVDVAQHRGARGSEHREEDDDAPTQGGGAHDLGRTPARRALDDDAVRVEQLDAAADLGQLGEVD